MQAENKTQVHAESAEQDLNGIHHGCVNQGRASLSSAIGC